MFCVLCLMMSNAVLCLLDAAIVIFMLVIGCTRLLVSVVIVMCCMLCPMLF